MANAASYLAAVATRAQLARQSHYIHATQGAAAAAIAIRKETPVHALTGQALDRETIRGLPLHS